MAVLIPKLSQQQNSDMGFSTSNGIVNVKMQALHFIAFMLKDSENNMRNINPFYTQKVLDGTAGKVKNITSEGCNIARRGIK
jgi:hypothetical protein